jgi:hypothetical protein
MVRLGGSPVVFIIGILIFVALVVLFYQVTNPPRDEAKPEHNFGRSVAAGTGTNAGSSIFSNAALQVAYIANGKLFYKAAGGVIKELHSPYIQEIDDRMARSKERNSWKKGTSFEVGAYGNMRSFAADGPQIRVTTARFDQPNVILYFLQDEGIGGLFSYDLKSGVETRILHRQHLALSDICLDVASRKIVCSSESKDGACNIATMTSDGNGLRELTGGDTIDCAPSWSDSEQATILYQSSGIARDQEGYIAAHGNISIQKLDTRTGTIEAVMEDPRFDYLQPRLCPKGNLHFIRRPYEASKYGAENVVLDTLFFPFRLLRALFHYLNFFSLMYSRKPLTGATGGPAVKADIKDIILKGRRIDAEKALRSESTVGGIPSLVPKSWQLVHRTVQGAETILATNVVSYDITADGQIIYSNGRGVFLCGPREPELLFKSDLVADVLSMPSALA